MPSKYSIKDLERLTGIKAHTLRIWEQRYEILNPERTDTNIRYYSNTDLKRILNISLLNNNGYKISNIAKLSHDRLLQEVRKILNNCWRESDQIESLVLCMMDLDEEKFEKIINTSISNFGFENTIEKIFFPFLKHLGDIWQVGIIGPAQEHYISNLIRQKLIAGIDRLKTQIKPEHKTYLFFLPSEELHEIGLLYVYYLTKAKGHKCLYLGQSLPLEDLVTISKAALPDFIVCILTTNTASRQLNSFLLTCQEQIQDADFLISGRLILANSCENLQIPSTRFNIFEDFESYKTWI